MNSSMRKVMFKNMLYNQMSSKKSVNHQYSVRWGKWKYYLCNRFKIHIKWKAKNILKRWCRTTTRTERGVVCVSIAKMKQLIMTGSSSTRRTILYRRNSRIHRKMLSLALSKSCDNARERCLRHIAMGIRNWLQTGSHF